MEITLAVILSYISNYLLAFIISLLGAFTSEMMTAMKNKAKINCIHVLAPSIFDGFLAVAVQNKFNFSFAIYAFICFMLGMWGLYLLQTLTNYKFIGGFLKYILKTSSSTIAKAADEGMQSIIDKSPEKKETTESEEEKKEKDL